MLGLSHLWMPTEIDQRSPPWNSPLAITIEDGVTIARGPFAVKRRSAHTVHKRSAGHIYLRPALDLRLSSMVHGLSSAYSFPFTTSTTSGKSISNLRSVSSVGTPFGVQPRHT
jgi:hypothetical protein